MFFVLFYNVFQMIHRFFIAFSQEFFELGTLIQPFYIRFDQIVARITLAKKK